MKRKQLDTSTIIALILVFLVMSSSLAFAGRDVNRESQGPFEDFDYHSLRKADQDKLRSYSGRQVVCRGTYMELLCNEAYFEYRFKLDSGDEIRVLTGRGLKHDTGDYLELQGFIMIREGRFSHLVVTDAKSVPRREKIDDKLDIPGLIPLTASQDAIYNRIFSWILYYNGGISRDNARFIANRIVHYSQLYHMDPFLVTAMISAESAFNNYAISVAGAVGLGQLMPGTAASLGVNPYNPEENINGSVRYLKAQLVRWENSSAPVALALASYNAGPGAVERYRGIPPFQETINYVNVVSSLYQQIRRGFQ